MISGSKSEGDEHKERAWEKQLPVGLPFFVPADVVSAFPPRRPCHEMRLRPAVTDGGCTSGRGLPQFPHP